MTEAENKELGNELEKLQMEKEELIEQIRELDRLKIEKLTKENEDLLSHFFRLEFFTCLKGKRITF